MLMIHYWGFWRHFHQLLEKTAPVKCMCLNSIQLCSWINGRVKGSLTHSNHFSMSDPVSCSKFEYNSRINITCHIAVVRDNITFDTSGNCSRSSLVVDRNPGGLDMIFSHALQERFGLHVRWSDILVMEWHRVVLETPFAGAFASDIYI